MLPEFQFVTGLTYLDQVSGESLLQYAHHLRVKAYSARTVANRVGRIQCFLRHHGIDKLLKPHEKPKFDKRIAEAYSEEELASLFKAANPRERLLFQFFAFSGCREAEVAHAEWRDINFPNSTMMVRSKRKKGFGPKDAEERLIPLPDSLMASLKAHRKANPTTQYLFPNRDNRPDGHHLRTLKKLALRGGLNCGECTSRNGKSCKIAPVCERWWLHKFRSTFATAHHESGNSARTLQSWLGHSDISTTVGYLAPADFRSERTRKAVNETFSRIAG